MEYTVGTVPDETSLQDKLLYYRTQIVACADAIACRCAINADDVELCFLLFDVDRAIDMRSEDRS